MNPNKTILRLLIFGQVFSLFFLILMPVLVRALHETWGRVVYMLASLVAIGLALALRSVLSSLE